MRYYEDLEIGQKIVFQNEYQVTEEEIIEMATRFDPQPFHIDKEAAEKSLFGGLTASSVHLFAMWVAIGTKDKLTDPIAAVSILGFDKLRITHPARPGDTLYVRSEILNKRLSNSRPGLGILTTFNEMYNQNDVVLLSAENTFLVQCREE
jgi:acyl dehydratase